ncbi:unnamed protein product [Staurois parvus]|uniref:Prostaglandin E2 receptor EP3 subtype n=1 Tax=Staurois parvus TaxID=386267 RepID=A0ABN9AYB1_9NEOB|nr:unnamed protein product [Staurois parvus]
MRMLEPSAGLCGDVTNWYPPLPHPNWLLLTVRLASCNQILDPWVYILLRRSVLHRLCSIFVRVARVRGGKPIRWDPGDFQSSDRSAVSHL